MPASLLRSELLAGRRLLVALSGGGDSMALLHLCLEAGLDVEAAHLDHAARPDSAEQAEWLRARCPVALHVRRASIERGTEGFEAAARRLRYAWLRELAGERLIVTGHTRDDVAETVLMKIVRGTWAGGLRGPRERRGSWLARPLLRASRADLRAYLQGRGLEWLEDPSNQDLRYLRNWVRLRALPVLAEGNPRVQDALIRLASSGSYSGMVRQWRALAPPGARLARAHLDRLAEGKSLDLPGGIRAEWRRSGLWMGRPEAPPDPVEVPFGEGDFPALGVRVRFGAGEAFDADRLPEGLVWRRRRPGDRFGSQKLKKKLIDWGLERHERDRLVVLAAGSAVVWVVGWRVHSRYRPGPGTIRELRVSVE